MLNINNNLTLLNEDKIASFDLGIISLYNRYPDLPWNRKMFSDNPSVRIKDIISHPEIFNTSPMEHYVTLFSIINDKYGYLKYKDDFPLHVVEEIISNNPTFPLSKLFVLIRVFNNHYITFTTRITIPHYHVDFRLNDMTILELESLDEFSDIGTCVSSNQNVTMQIVLANPNFKWCWHSLSYNKGITMKDIMSHPQFDWDYELAITFRTVKEYFKYRHLSDLDASHTFNYIKVSMEDFTLYPELLQLITSDLPYCCTNSSLAPDILNHFGLPIDYNYFSLNSNVTMDYILKNIDKNWNWNFLSSKLVK